MRSFTGSRPKVLVPVRGTPFAHHQLTWLARQGVTSVVYCIGHLGGAVRRYVGEGEAWGVSVGYVDEGRELRGTGGALRLALDQGALPPEFFVMYGDSYLPIALAPVADSFAASPMPALMTVYRNEGRWGDSNVRFDGRRVELYQKGHPEPSAAGLDYVDYGLSLLRRDVVEEVPRGRFTDLADVFHRLSREGRLAGLEVHQRFYEVGSPAGLRDLEAYLARTPES